MYAWRMTAAAGVMMLSLGALFHLQGLGLVGPESSFMYSSPAWAGYGGMMMVAGLVLAIPVALALRRRG